MPCLTCGARQDDPARGPSPWKRGVSGGVQVLVCPDCQRTSGWQSRLDHCPACDGVRLSKTLGVLRCSACGWTGEPAGEASASERETPDAGQTALSAEVQAALDRVLGRPPNDSSEPAGT